MKKGRHGRPFFTVAMQVSGEKRSLLLLELLVSEYTLVLELGQFGQLVG